MTISLKVLLQLFLKYAEMLDILIDQFDHTEFFNDTLAIFQNNFVNELDSSLLQSICFLKI